jgi:hypothetical protein
MTGTPLRDVITIPESISAGDYVLKLTEGSRPFAGPFRVRQADPSVPHGGLSAGPAVWRWKSLVPEC